MMWIRDVILSSLVSVCALAHASFVSEMLAEQCSRPTEPIDVKTCGNQGLMSLRLQLGQTSRDYLLLAVDHGYTAATENWKQAQNEFVDGLAKSCPGFAAACLDTRYRARIAAVAVEFAKLRRDGVESTARRVAELVKTQKQSENIVASNNALMEAAARRRVTDQATAVPASVSMVSPTDAQRLEMMAVSMEASGHPMCRGAANQLRQVGRYFAIDGPQVRETLELARRSGCP